MIVMPTMRGVLGAGQQTPDPFFSSVVALGHLNGAVGSTGPYPNNATNAITFNRSGSNASLVLSNTQVRFGATSMRFPAVAGLTMTTPGSTFTVGNSDFVMEWWQYADNVTQVSVLSDQRPISTNGLYPTIYMNASTLRYFVSSADRITSASSVLVATTWQYIAVARVSGNTRAYVGAIGGGTAAQVGSTYVDANNYLGVNVWLGSNSNLAGPFLGYFDDYRFTIGNGRGYTGATIPVPTAPFANS